MKKFDCLTAVTVVVIISSLCPLQKFVLSCKIIFDCLRLEGGKTSIPLQGKTIQKMQIFVRTMMRCGFNQYCPRCHWPRDPSLRLSQKPIVCPSRNFYHRNSGSRSFYYRNVCTEILDQQISHQDGFIRDFSFESNRFWI